MKLEFVLLVAVAAGGLLGCVAHPTASPTPTRMMTTRLGYPETAKQDLVDDYHGTKIPDPYRWLEDDNAPETKAWVAAQNRVTFHYLDQIPERARLKERLTKLWNFERYGIPFKQGGRYFYS